jgi:hypothetical protein
MPGTDNLGTDESSTSPNERTIALWGASQAGKTTSLAAYLGKYKPRWIARDHALSTATVRRLQEIWDTLQRNRLTSGTTIASEYVLRHRAHCTLKFRDMKGDNVRNWAEDEDIRALQQAAAAMLFIDWPGPQAANNRTAMGLALQTLRPEQPAVLLVTKCESHLTAAEFSAFADDPLGFAERPDCPDELREWLGNFREHLPHAAVFPISVYGWNGPRPAHCYDEFGRLVPWHIRPALVDRPFEHILNRLGLEGDR